jgi:hypothetical protein
MASAASPIGVRNRRWDVEPISYVTSQVGNQRSKGLTPLKTLEIELSTTQLVVAAPEQISCDLGGEEVILDLNTGVYYGLNPVGSRIWSLIHEPRSTQEILDVMMSEYEVNHYECEQQVLDFLNELAERGLVEIK